MSRRRQEKEAPIIEARVAAPETGAPVSRAERRRAERARAAAGLPVEDARPPWRRMLKTALVDTPFRLGLALLFGGILFLASSQLIPHDYGFLELGALFTLSVYDLVLAMLGLSVALAMAPSGRVFAGVVAVFAGILLVMLLFFDPLFVLIRVSPLGQVLYLIAPFAVVVSGITLWTEGRLRIAGLYSAAAVVGFSFALFVGLDDLGVGIADFASGALFCALWLIAVPGLLLRPFGGPWLKIPSRILGSWLLVIAVIVTVSLYVPMPVIAPPPPAISGQGPLAGPLGSGSVTVPDGMSGDGPGDMQDDGGEP